MRSSVQPADRNSARLRHKVVIAGHCGRPTTGGVVVVPNVDAAVPVDDNRGWPRAPPPVNDHDAADTFGGDLTRDERRSDVGRVMIVNRGGAGGRLAGA